MNVPMRDSAEIVVDPSNMGANNTLSRQSDQPSTIHVIIVTFNSASFIDACLSSLVSQGVELTITVVDNASTDDTVRIIQDGYPDVRLFRLQENRGFSAANNVALGTEKAAWTLILNPDTSIPPGTLSRLIERVSDHPEIGIVGCRLETAGGQFDHAAKRRLPTPASALRYSLSRRGAGRSAYLAREIGERQSGAVECINGAFMLISEVAVHQIGHFDERYWMYAEDIDYCRRAASAGYSIWYEGSETVLHLKGASSGKYRRTRLNWQFHKSMILYYRKFDAHRSATLSALVYAAILVRFVISASVAGAARASSASARTVHN